MEEEEEEVRIELEVQGERWRSVRRGVVRQASEKASVEEGFSSFRPRTAAVEREILEKGRIVGRAVRENK